MPKTETFDADGDLISTEIKPATWTISYQHKVPRHGGFGAGEEFGIFAQVEVDPSDDLDDIENKIKSYAAFVKATVFQQLGLTYASDEATGVITCLEVEAEKASKAAPKSQSGGGARKAAGKPAGSGGPKRDAAEMWAEYEQDPDRWWDNRVNKRNPKGPDFKHKDTGEGLWLDSAPDGLFD